MTPEATQAGAVGTTNCLVDDQSFLSTCHTPPPNFDITWLRADRGAIQIEIFANPVG